MDRRAAMNALTAGSVLGRFTIEGVLGEGALAVVYRVKHKDLGTRHALKVLKVPHEIVVERLMNEGRAQAALRHPNVVSVTDIVDVNGSPGLLMEYVEGATLKEVLKMGRLSLQQAAAVGRGLLAGVSAAHRAGLIHRDLKPANVLMAIQGHRMVPKITDFGLVKALDGDAQGSLETRTGIVLGTPQYMAPEQFDDARGVDRRADVFSMGVILYEIVCGERPYTGKGLLEIVDHARKGAFVPIEERVPDVPEGMRAAIEAALQPEVDDRVGNCEVLYRMWTETDSGADLDALFQTDLIERLKFDVEASLERSIDRQPPRTPIELRESGGSPDTDDTHEAPRPASEPDPASEASDARSPLLFAAIALLALFVVGLSGAALVGAGALAMLTPGPTPRALGTPPAPEVPEVPDPPGPTAPEPAPEPVGTVAPVPDPIPEPVGTVAPVPQPAPEPVGTVAPVPGPAPEPVGTVAPVPEPVPPAPLSPDASVVSVVGDHTSFSLLASDGRTFGPGEVPPGTYTIYAAFPDDPVNARGTIEVRTGDRLKLKCDGVVRYSCDPF
ncbi:MAG: protein kinase [Myxococcota bacterium]